ncbi:MAG: TIGR03557 family F420-dependent LLM class oxidoreductase [Ktedonobacteraceae bacterium]
MMLQLGYKAAPEQFPPTELLGYAIDAEKFGFDTIDVSDHFHPWSEEGQAAFTWTWLGAAASHTNRIHLGTGLTCPILRYHPAIIAQAAATVSCFAPGRTYLSVGTGEALNEYAATGMWPGYEEREERLLEAIDLIRKLWSGEEVTFEGKYYKTKKARLFTPPAAPIPLYYSALVPRSAQMAGKYGDGLITVGGKKLDLYKQILKNFEDGARQAGKNPANMAKLIELNVEYTNDLEKAIEYQQKYWAGSYIPALYDQKIYTPAMSEQNGEVVGPDAIKKSGCVSGSAEDHIKFATQYIDLGFDQLFFHSAYPDQSTFLQRYAQDVLPSLRQKGR